jgi:hypothetical protein
MFKRQWFWFGKLISDESYTLAFGSRSITYREKRGSFEFGLEDGFSFSNAISNSRRASNTESV